MTIIVTTAHMRKANVCWRGSRNWLQSKNLSSHDFAKHGLPIELLEAFDDPIVNRICAIAREESLNE